MSTASSSSWPAATALLGLFALIAVLVATCSTPCGLTGSAEQIVTRADGRTEVTCR